MTLTRRFKRIGLFLISILGINRYFFYRNRNKQRILVFHHIIPDNLHNDSFEQRIVCSTQSHFAWLLSIVNKRFEVTTEIGKPGSAVITFDDGYRAALIAEKELDKYNNKAYFFVPLSIISAGPLWVERIMGWFAYVASGEYTINGKTYTFDSQTARLKAYDETMSSLYGGHYDVDALICQLDAIFPFAKLDIPAEYYDLRFRGLTNDEIERLKQHGHKIGGHSVNHDILSQLDDIALTADFSQCSAKIGNLFNCEVYAYPFGHKRDVSANSIEACSRSGFTQAVMNEYVPDATKHKLSRMNISAYTSKYEIEANLSGFKQWVKNMRKWRK